MKESHRVYLNLMREFMITDFKLKYQSSLIGYLWSLLNPLLMFSVLYVVFSQFARFEVEHYHLFLLLGVILWGYFSEATTNAMLSMQAKAGIIKKIYFPREIIVLASNGATFLTLLLNFVVFFLFVIISKVTPTIKILLLPVYFLELVILTYGISLLLSALYVRYIDTLHLWRVFLQIGFWITPIIYPLTMVPEEFQKYMLINPLAGLINQIRDISIYHITPSITIGMTTAVMSIVIYLVGRQVFKRMAPKFAEWV